jgi:hypothetical protein
VSHTQTTNQSMTLAQPQLSLSPSSPTLTRSSPSN